MPSEVRNLLVSAVALLMATAAAQYDIVPFEDDPVAISAAYGAEMAVLRLQAAEALLDEGLEADEVEEVLEGLELERMRFGAALEEADADLAARADEAFDAVEDADDPAAAVSEALPVAREVREAVSEPVVEDPAYAAAVMTLLLVSEAGVAEGWEEAVEGEVGPYAVGWAGMPRLYALWERLKPLANENQVFEIEDRLGVLQALFEAPTPPNMDGADPEAGEGAAVHVAGFLEDVTGAWLFPDRDLAALVATTRELTSAGCDAYAAGERLRGDAHLAWTAFVHDEYVAGTLGLLAPETTRAMGEALMELVPREVEGDEGEEDEDEDTDDDGEERERPDAEEIAERCGSLLNALDEAGAALGV